MTDYVKSTNFASKDALSTGNPLKIVKGTEIDTEFTNIATAVATKADLLSPVFSGTPTAPTAATATNNTQLATTAYTNNVVIAERTATTTLTNKSLTSPALTGTPTAPTASVDTNTTQVATTAFVVAQIADDAPSKTGTNASGNWGISISGTAPKLSTASGTAPSYSARAWVSFDGTGANGTNQTIRASGNVSNVFKNSTGNYTITLTTALSDANYSVVSTAGRASSALTHSSMTGTPTSSTVTVVSYIPGGTVSAVDSDYMNVVLFR